MNGYEIFRRALSLAGISCADGSASDEAVLLKRAADALSHICTDLGIPAPKGLSERITACEEKLDACVCGVAMLMAAGSGDRETARLFTDIYNGKRATAKRGITAVRDVLPVDDGGNSL